MTSPRRRSSLVGRRALENRHHGDVAVDDLDLDAEAVVLAFLPLAHLRVVRGLKKLECGSSVFSMPSMAL